jgi:hypothetical protein
MLLSERHDRLVHTTGALIDSSEELVSDYFCEVSNFTANLTLTAMDDTAIRIIVHVDRDGEVHILLEGIVCQRFDIRRDSRLSL